MQGLERANAASFSTPTSKARRAASCRRSPRRAALFHWKSQRKQVRIRGPIEVVSDAEADAYFAGRPAWQPHRGLGQRAIAPRSRRAPRSSRLSPRSKRGTPTRSCRDRRTGVAFASCHSTSSFWSDGEFRLHDRILFARETSAERVDQGASVAVTAATVPAVDDRSYPSRPILAASVAVIRDDRVLLARRVEAARCGPLQPAGRPCRAGRDLDRGSVA